MKKQLSVFVVIFLLMTVKGFSQDNDKNWMYVRNYDEAGNEIGASKSFFDTQGNPVQAQVKIESTGKILASQTLYDLNGRAAINTLPAPISGSSFLYNSNFITSGGSAYDYTHFDWNSTFSSTAPYSKTTTPDAVDNTSPGTLGWYYSNNNTLEPMVATTGYPYFRRDFYHDGSGAAKRFAGTGDVLKIGSGHEIIQNGFPIINELTNYLAIRNQFFPSTQIGASPSSLTGQAVGQINIDPNGNQNIIISDLSGNPLMTGRADINGWLTVNNSFTLSGAVLPQYVLYVNNYFGSPLYTGISDVSAFQVSSTNPISVYCNGCGQSLVYQGQGNGFAVSGIPAGQGFAVVSAFPFTITGNNSSGLKEFDQSPGRMSEPTSATIQYFQLTSASLVTITAGFAGCYTLYDMKNELDITSSFTSGGTLAAGYYKVTSILNSSGNSSAVTVNYTNKFSDISYNFYDQIGHLIVSIAPNGVQKLIQSGLSGYASYNVLPFIAIRQYDLQGRLISASTPDGGTSQFIYRGDGNIRFSQNSYQSKATNAGTGYAEKLSYTNYDRFGRMIESGEYAEPAATFASLSTNSGILEATDGNGGLSGGIKTLYETISYDLPNLSLTGYVQDPGFLKGQVSYITNGTSTTWYNYDDHGRFTWTVKKLPAFTLDKTVDYAYNDQGNTALVDYQRGTSAERFIHYYYFDADARLLNVKTSRDGTTMTQQANYYYYTHGPLKRAEIGNNLQGMDYVYTVQGFLKAINSPTNNPANDPNKDGTGTSLFAADAFGLQVEYFPGDYSRANSNINPVTPGGQTYYDGKITGMSWQTNKPAAVVSMLGTGIQAPTMYTYSYDPNYRYSQSIWGAPNFTAGSFTPSSTNIYQEKSISYDANGNLLGLQRTNSTGAISDDFSKYQYAVGTNQLTSVGNTAGSSIYATYTYDEIGRVKTQTKGGVTWYYKFDVNNHLTGVYSNSIMTAIVETIAYDENGNRFQTVNGIGTSDYIADASGNTMAVYTGTTPVLSEIMFYGRGRLGTYYVPANNYVYEIRNVTGSVIMAINGNKNTTTGQADIYAYNDYYPYGSTLRNSTPLYRYGYQGGYAEQDQAINYNAFSSRMYESKDGRWLSMDPDQQSNSPYAGMGGNPVSFVDKDGKLFGLDNLLAPVIGAVVGGGINAIGQLIENSGTNKKFSWRSVAVASANGAISGELLDCGLPPVLSLPISAVQGAAADYVDQKWNDPDKAVNWTHVVVAGGAQTLFGGLSGRGAQLAEIEAEESFTVGRTALQTLTRDHEWGAERVFDAAGGVVNEFYMRTAGEAFSDANDSKNRNNWNFQLTGQALLGQGFGPHGLIARIFIGPLEQVTPTDTPPTFDDEDDE